MTKHGKDDGEQDEPWNQELSDGVIDSYTISIGSEHGDATVLPESWQRMDRLQSFDDVIGQDEVRDALSAHVKIGHTQNHVIFYGEHGVGKKAIASLYGQAIVCSNPDARRRPCGACAGCEDFASRGWNGEWIDIAKMVDMFRREAHAKHFHHPSPERRQSIIEREVNERLSENIEKVVEHIKEGSLGEIIAQSSSVILIDNVDLLSVGLVDRFLTELEGGGAGAICIFLTCDLRSIRPALRSRCQAYRIRPLDRDQSRERLMRACERGGLKFQSDVIELIAGQASYRAGTMLQYLWEVCQAGPMTLEQARTALGLDWVERAHYALSMMATGDIRQVKVAIRQLSDKPHEALSRLRITLQALSMSELIQSRDRDALMPPAFMYVDDRLLTSLQVLLMDDAIRMQMALSEYRVWLMGRLNDIEASRPATILAEIVWLSRTMGGCR